jgi:hypothetical protein
MGAVCGPASSPRYSFVIVACALEPHKLAHHVEAKRLDSSVAVLLDFEFDLVALDRTVAQGAALACPVTTPHP